MIFFRALLLFFCVCFLAAATTVNARTEAMYLKNRFQEARPGDYLVVLQNRHYTLFHVFEKTNSTIVIEEISVPESLIPRSSRKDKSFTFSWKQWMQQPKSAQGCWAIYEISLMTGKIIDYYSISQRSWVDVSRVENFLPTLLNLKFSPTPNERRRKIGAPPLAGESDSRRLWQPPLTVDGKVVKRAMFDSWEGNWPKDKSQISCRKVLIYMLKDYPATPAYFPFWIEIPDAPAQDRIRVVDSGRDMRSPTLVYPRRPS